MSGTSNLLNGAAAIGVGAYLIGVAWKGNVSELGSLLVKDKGYIDFVIALFVIGAIQKYGPASKVSSALTAIAVIGMLIRVVNKAPNFNSTMTDFANGKIGIFETIKQIVGA